MLTTYDIYLNGFGHYKVDASICRIPTTDDMECEIELIKIIKFDDMLEEYTTCDVSEEEVGLIEREVAIKFFNNLH